MKDNNLKNYYIYILLLLLICFSSCSVDKKLATFNLGANRNVEITRYNFDSNFPIYCELSINEKVIIKELIDYEGMLLDYDYKVFEDSSKNKFAIVQISPSKTEPEAILDLENLKSPVICNKYNQEINRNNLDVCRRSANKFMEMIEENNPNLRLNSFNKNLNSKVEN